MIMKIIEGYDVKIFTDNIEENALAQIKELLSIDVFSDKKIRIMPDVHAGAGCVIGFTGDLGDKVIPNIVGVDIGCGMRILKLGKLSDIDFPAFHKHIRANVPSGKIVREDRFGFTPLAGEEIDIYREAKRLVTELYCYREIKNSGRINKAIGTLGGGNHFIELDRDDDRNVYLIIHTGSRNLGKQVAEIYQTKAVKHLTDGADEFEETIKRIIEEYKAAGRRSELQSVIKKMRKEQGLTQKQFAESMKIPQSTVSYLENGRQEVTDYLLSRIAKHYHVDNIEDYVYERDSFVDPRCVQSLMDHSFMQRYDGDWNNVTPIDIIEGFPIICKIGRVSLSKDGIILIDRNKGLGYRLTPLIIRPDEFEDSSLLYRLTTKEWFDDELFEDFKRAYFICCKLAEIHPMRQISDSKPPKTGV